MKIELSKHRLLRENLDLNFVELSNLLGLDPQQDFKGCRLRNLDLRNLNLAGFDFSGADLWGCSWENSDIREAIFDRKSNIDLLEVEKANASDESTRTLGIDRVVAWKRTLELIRGTLGISWMATGQSFDTLVDYADELVRVLSSSVTANGQETDLGLSASETVKGALDEWKSASGFGDEGLAAEAIRKVLYLRRMTPEIPARILATMSIVMRLELHRRKCKLFYASSDDEKSQISDLILSSLINTEDSELEIFFQVLEGARPSFEGKWLQVGVVATGRVVSIDPTSGRITVKYLGSEHFLEEKLTSPAWFHSAPEVGEISFVSSRRFSKITQKGKEYVEAVLELLFPVSDDGERPTRVHMGASNSWALIQTSRNKQNTMLSNGEIVEQLRAACGLRRVTVTMISGDRDVDIKHFINDVYRDIQIEDMSGGRVWGKLVNPRELKSFVSSGSSIYDHPKVRTFLSMWGKVFPGVGITVSISDEKIFSFKKYLEHTKEQQQGL